ncbi:MAG: glycosyltransferase family 2 protein [Bacteroidota bacterium]|nr:glycosyltransferase family 2 protein [Bacteroidota bacterium]
MYKITIIIPCRNEEKFIENCILSILNFDDINNYDYEMLLIDGRSDDNTRSIIHQYILANNRIKLIDNPKIIQSCALNIGIKQAKGDWIMRLDAHANYPKNYLKKLFDTALKTNADNTGGIINTLPYNSSYSAIIIQALTTHKFGVGNSGFRIGIAEGETDTVPYGFFKKEIFNKIGFFNEQLVRGQDYEFNCRIKKNGGKIWLNPDIKINYFNQPNIFRFLRKQYVLEAPYNVYMWYVAPNTFTLRHSITGFFTSGIITGIILSLFVNWICMFFVSVLLLYFILAFLSSVQQAIRYKKILHIFTLPLCFFSFHFIHGLGIIVGLIKILTKKSPVQISV